jgi:short-subunit dehydrogenase involved in D-alanine esterification of teichoic acids
MAVKFTEKDIPDLSGYVIIVTGGRLTVDRFWDSWIYAKSRPGNSGIGLETTKQLALRHARVYIASRSQERVQKAIEELQSTTEQKLDLHFLQLDLLDLKSVKAAAARFTQLESRLDILINNAGVCKIVLFSQT